MSHAEQDRHQPASQPQASQEPLEIYGDAFDDRVTDYVSMMRFNADSLRACLGA